MNRLRMEVNIELPNSVRKKWLFHVLRYYIECGYFARMI